MPAQKVTETFAAVFDSSKDCDVAGTGLLQPEKQPILFNVTAAGVRRRLAAKADPHRLTGVWGRFEFPSRRAGW